VCRGDGNRHTSFRDDRQTRARRGHPMSTAPELDEVDAPETWAASGTAREMLAAYQQGGYRVMLVRTGSFAHYARTSHDAPAWREVQHMEVDHDLDEDPLVVVSLPADQRGWGLDEPVCWVTLDR
jgi:hypothetical protein